MSRRCAVAALLATLAGCEAAPWIEDDQRLLPKWRRLLRAEAKVRAQTLDEQLTLPALGPESAVVVVDPNWRVPGVLSTDQQRAAMRGFLESGGRLVLFGHAAKLVGELGLEDHLIAAITGHDIDETRRILKVYMPRTTGRAARAIALASVRQAQDQSREKAG